MEHHYFKLDHLKEIALAEKRGADRILDLIHKEVAAARASERQRLAALQDN